MSATVAQVLELVNDIAPFDLAEEWDNVGLLAGRPDAAVKRVLCALDLRMEVLEEAASRDVQLIVTHHPILFRGRKNLCETDAEGRLLCALVRSGIALIAAHTNYDNASPGVNDVLAARIGLEEVQSMECGVRVGRIKKTDFGMLCALISEKLGGPVRRYGDPSRGIQKVAVLGGAGGDYACIAASAGAEAFVTGEMSYHKALDAVDSGLCVIEAGHAATETPAISNLRRGLQKASDAVEYGICVLQSEVESFF